MLKLRHWQKKIERYKEEDKKDLNIINKKISVAIRRNIRQFNTNEIYKTMEKNKNFKMRRRKLNHRKSGIEKLKNIKRETTSNSLYFLTTVEEFCSELLNSHKQEGQIYLDKLAKTSIVKNLQV